MFRSVPSFVLSAILIASAVAVEPRVLSADGSTVDVIGHIDGAPAILRLDESVTVEAYVANVIEQITSNEQAFLLRGAKAVPRGRVKITGRLWWAGAAQGQPSYVIDVLSAAPAP